MGPDTGEGGRFALDFPLGSAIALGITTLGPVSVPALALGNETSGTGVGSASDALEAFPWVVPSPQLGAFSTTRCVPELGPGRGLRRSIPCMV